METWFHLFHQYIKTVVYGRSLERGGGRGAFVKNPTSVTNNAVTSHRVMVIMRWQAPRQRGAREALLARW